MLPHGGRGPPARILGLVLPCGVCTPASAGVEEEIEEANGIAVAYAPTLPLSHNRRLCLPLLWEIFSYFFEMIKDYSLCTNGKFVRPIK